MQPERAITEDHARKICLIVAMRRWNVQLRSKMCCPYHTAVVEATRALEDIKARPCDPNYIPKGCLQCSCCGVLSPHQEDVEETCDVCLRGFFKPCAESMVDSSRVVMHL